MLSLGQFGKALPVAFVIAGLGAAQSARADVVQFLLSNVEFTTTSLNGNPFSTVDYGSAAFTWTYSPGSFTGGTGHLDWITLPFGAHPNGPAVYNADISSMDGSQTVNQDSWSYDFSISYSGLTGPTSVGQITGGSFDLTGTKNYLSGEYMGSITGGTVSPVPEPATLSILAVGLLGAARRRRK